MSRKLNKKRLWIIIGAVVVVAGLVVANIVTKKGPKGEKVDVTVAKLDSLVQTVTASGKIQPKVDVNISASVSGRILFLGAEEGDIVKEGQQLVQIEDENYKAQLNQMEFSLRSAQAQLEESQSKQKRVRELHKAQLSSDADLEGADALVKRLKAEVDRAKANVDQARDSYSKTRIYSPISGTVTRLNKELGEMAIGATFSQDVIMMVSKLDQMEVDVEVNENDVVLIGLGDQVKIEVFAMPDTSFHGKVTEIAHSGVVRGTGTAEEVTNFNVKVAVTDHVPQLRPGMSATVEIITDRREKTLVLPQEAVAVRTFSEEEKMAAQARISGKKAKKKNGGNDDSSPGIGGSKEDPVEVVFVVKSDTVWAQRVRLGIYSDTHFEILSGINEGDVVVTGPFRLLSRDLHSGRIVSYTPPPELKKEESPGDEAVADSTE
ncbi:MAG: efflux RND transporter periplasmic adaptor subunit [bacterium]